MEQTQGTAGQTSAPSSQDKASTRALVALVLGILSCLFFGLFAGIPAIIVGRKEEKAIARGEAPVAGRTIAKVGWILGIVGSSLWCLFGILIQAFFGIFLLMGVKT